MLSAHPPPYAGEESGSDTYDKMCANKLTPAAGDSGKDGGGDKAGAAEDADMDAEADDGASSDEGMEEEDGADGPDVVDLAGSSDEEEDAKVRWGAVPCGAGALCMEGRL